jgi:peroxiredoxin
VAIPIAPHLTIGTPAPAIELVDKQGQSIRLADYWAQGPTLLSFLRHYG